jgi:8-oxo-dGTP diphosphatase
MQFQNKPNQAVFISRSVAVLVVPIYKYEGLYLVPLGKRSNKVSDAGKWCLPCGYLDWNESAYEAAIREAWEELGLDLSAYLPEQPWYVNSDPNADDRQNVTLRFGAVIECETLPVLKTSEEVDEAMWCLIEAAIKSTNLAFNQNQVIHEFLKNEGFKL